MKSLSTANFNRLGLSTPGKKVLWAAGMLRGGTLPNKIQTLLKPGVPAVTAIPGKAAVIGTGTATAPQYPAVVAVLGVPAVAPIKSPIVTPSPDWINSVQIDDSSAAYTKINAVLPYSPAAIALGVVLDAKQIQEVTVPGLFLGEWYGSLAGITPTTEPDVLVAGLPATVEQILYINARLLPVVAGTTNKIAPALYKPTPTANAIPVIAIEVFVGK